MKNKKKSSSKTRRLVLIGALGGISIFLGVSGLGLIRLPIFSLTIMHIPVIIGALLEGPVVGISVGLIFGLFSMYQNITAPGLTSFIFWNPIVALIPRMLIGIVAYYSFKLIKNTGVCAGIAAVLGTLTNTIGVLGLTYILYLDQYAQAREISREAVAGTLLTVGLTNGIPEAIVSALITIPIVVTMLKLKRN